MCGLALVAPGQTGPDQPRVPLHQLRVVQAFVSEDIEYTVRKRRCLLAMDLSGAMYRTDILTSSYIYKKYTSSDLALLHVSV